MLTRFNEIIRRHLTENIWLYCIMVFFFVLGVCLGALAVNNVSVDAKNELRSYMEGFLNITESEGIYAADILKQSVIFNFITIIVIFFFGMTYFGIAVIPIIAGFRGFCIGFTVAFLTESFSRGGYLLSLVSILPQNIIYIPVLIILCVCSLCLSLNVLRNRYIRKYNQLSGFIMPYSITMVVLFGAMLAGSLIESYLTPFIIRFVIPYVT
ncbi:MAG: stage II sporulation protein M [Bacillota bacterium]